MEPAARTSDLALAVSDLVKTYGSTKALDGVSLGVRRGEFVALLGPNGAGKSTLFQLLSGLFTPDGGSIEVAGHDIRKNAVPALSSLGIVFQSPTLDQELSILANLRFHTDLHGMPRGIANARIAAELGAVGLVERQHDPVRTLSGGNKRRVELARALLHEPSILLMDEPTVGLDPRSRREILTHVLMLKRERKIAVLWATHLVEEAEESDRVVVMARGKVLRSGTSADLRREMGTETLSEAFLELTRGDASEAA
ncbi:MAG: ATP-binding cassette domain-containing protein [Alphaproteobacteria bacterium]|nr:ATP-binding cassette domain-containing protein [Alphaproteobacteria bacterium]